MKYTLGLVALLSALLFSFDTAHAGVFTGKRPYDVNIKTTTNTAVVTIKVVADASSYSLSICKGDEDNRHECIIPATRIGTEDGTGTKTFTYNNLTPGTLYTMLVQGGKKGYYEFSTDKAYASAGTGSLSFQTKNNSLIGTATVSALDKNANYYVFYYPDLASADNITGAKIIDIVAAKPGVTWQFTSSVPVNDFYYGRLVGKDAAGKHTFLSGPVETALYYTRKLEFRASGDKAVAIGYINTDKHTNFRDFTATVYVSKGTILTATGNEQADAFYTTANQSGIAEDGSYKITISNLDENALYYFRHIIASPAGTKDAIADSFNSTRGYVPEGSIEKGADFDKRSYHLLAPFPGLTAVLDPDLCREQQKEGKLGAGQVCGINEFINLILKLLVGITAVLLVIRIIIEGYNYVVTDVPFLKMSAKTHLFESVFGLILALSSYLILNTINPKLVSNDISIRQEALSTEPGNDGIGIVAPGKKLTLKTKSGKDVVVTACDSSQMASVSAFGTTFQIQKNLVPSIKRIDTKWKQLNPAYKIPLTVSDKNTMGGYVCRNTGSGKLSYHAYGLSVDINPSANPQGKTLKTDMPKAFVQLWKDEGWGWGGEWQSSKDAMHFSKGKNELGDMTMDD